MAPPLTFTLSRSQPMSLFTAQAWAAKASFASTRSRSDAFQPAFSSALREAGIGPVPMIAGSTPAVAHEAIRASGSMPRFSASSSVISTTAAAPSFRPAALPAVTVPSLEKAGRSFVIASIVAPSADVLVLVDHDVALAGLDREGRDLVLEPAGLLRRLGLVLAGERELVLLLAADLPLPGHVLGGGAHVVAVEGVPEPVLDHRVDEASGRPSSARRAGARRASTATCSPGRPRPRSRRRRA